MTNKVPGLSTSSPTNTLKNCTKCGKGLEFGTKKLSSCRPRIDLGEFRKFSPFVFMPIWLLETKVYNANLGAGVVTSSVPLTNNFCLYPDPLF